MSQSVTTHSLVCLTCARHFKAVRHDALTCSDLCRSKRFRDQIRVKATTEAFARAKALRDADAAHIAVLYGLIDSRGLLIEALNAEVDMLRARVSTH